MRAGGFMPHFVLSPSSALGAPASRRLAFTINLIFSSKFAKVAAIFRLIREFLIFAPVSRRDAGAPRAELFVSTKDYVALGGMPALRSYFRNGNSKLNAPKSNIFLPQPVLGLKRVGCAHQLLRAGDIMAAMASPIHVRLYYDKLNDYLPAKKSKRRFDYSLRGVEMIEELLRDLPDSI
jgi:hypothetical protein